MRFVILSLLLGAFLAFSGSSTLAVETMAGEKAEHPRIAKAIHALDEAIEYMERAPHDFGGHKAQALEASRKAEEQLKLALEYRMHQENKGKK